MKIVTLIAFLAITLLANNTKLCKQCHPLIYNEFEHSLHKQSSRALDTVHKAVWDLHPLKRKGQYKCAKCHEPNHEEHINCLTCHTITKIQKHQKSNSNIYEHKDKLFYSAQKEEKGQRLKYQKNKSFFGLLESTKGSPYHEIDYTNTLFYDGSVCMGCHSHKQNGHKLTVCKTTSSDDAKHNCITCHMPKVKGSATTIRQSDTHAFHGFAGVWRDHKMLSKYIELTYQKTSDGFYITIHNKAPHDLLTHPLRVVKLLTKLTRDGKTQELPTHTFVKVLGKNNKPAMPWIADMILKNTMIKANETRIINFTTKLQKGDEIESILGFFPVNPKAAKKLKLEDDASLTHFTTLQKLHISVDE